MVHTIMPKKDVASFPRGELCVASVNHTMQQGEGEAADEVMLSVTLCGPASAVAEYVAEHPVESVELKPMHPWHHSSYAAVSGRYVR